jgi:hypothetical protein
MSYSFHAPTWARASLINLFYFIFHTLTVGYIFVALAAHTAVIYELMLREKRL